MRIKVKNLGVLKQAEFSLGDFTIICGENNTGKTYATYALYGFLDLLRKQFRSDDHRYLPKRVFDDLVENGVSRLNLAKYAQNAQKILNRICRGYSLDLHDVFSASQEKFQDCQFRVFLENNTMTSSIKSISFERNIGIGRQTLSLTKDKESEELEVSLLVDKQRRSFTYRFVERRIAGAIHEIIFGSLFPTPFIASAERTGSAIFRKELNFARNRLLKEMSQADEKIDPRELLYKSYQDYPLPVEKNVDFTRQLEDVVKQKSFLTDKHPEVLKKFADIIGGEYRVTRNNELFFVPRGKRVKLGMDESASGVRSMLDIGFYLRHVAKRGDLLMVDEPELNLHPENQRRIARLFAQLVNLGIKVFITTHSDYIVKELNTLIMLNQEKSHLKKIAKREGYDKSEFLNSEKIKMYIAEEDLIMLDGNQRRTRCQTLVKAKIDPELGIEARSFDKTINEMNEIQDAILWEED
ncbi:MAG: ATP-binding protein [Nitrospinae bacterium]|nr:ATP-binding protein [Nitrospinota bacterium]